MPPSVLGELAATFSGPLIRARVPGKPVKPEITRYEKNLREELDTMSGRRYSAARGASLNGMDAPFLNRHRGAKVGVVSQPLLRGSVTMKITTIGIDLAKMLLQVHGVDKHGKVGLRKQLKA